MWEYSSFRKDNRISMLRGVQKATSVRPTRRTKQAVLARVGSRRLMDPTSRGSVSPSITVVPSRGPPPCSCQKERRAQASINRQSFNHQSLEITTDRSEDTGHICLSETLFLPK